MSAYADLHLHTAYSDGRLSPKEIFEKAEKAGLAAISITDHDSLDGCIEAQSLRSNYKVDFINGIEFSCIEEGREYHILGYDLDPDNEVLKRYLLMFRDARLKRAEKIVQKLKRINLPINFDVVLEKAGGAPIARPHIASVMRDLGYINSLKEAFLLYLGEGKPAYEMKAQFHVEKAIEIINQSGGVAVLAHPARMVSSDALYKMIESGLDGIEVVHPMHDKDLQDYYRTIAAQYWLIETGGSDYHGTRDFDEDNFGRFVVPYSVVETIRYHAVKR